MILFGTETVAACWVCSGTGGASSSCRVHGTTLQITSLVVVAHDKLFVREGTRIFVMDRSAAHFPDRTPHNLGVMASARTIHKWIDTVLAESWGVDLLIPGGGGRSVARRQVTGSHFCCAGPDVSILSDRSFCCVPVGVMSEGTLVSPPLCYCS